MSLRNKVEQIHCIKSYTPLHVSRTQCGGVYMVGKTDAGSLVEQTAEK
jgi:hypothetical protein